MAYTVTSKINLEKRGASLPNDQQRIVRSLRSRAFELQKRFQHANQTARLLEQLLSKELNVSQTISDTFEAHAFINLRFQLFRILIVDIAACLLDNRKKTASVKRLINELKRKNVTDAIAAYYLDTDCLDIEIKFSDGSEKDHDPEEIRRKFRDDHRARHQETIDKLTTATIEFEKTLYQEETTRILWARNKTIAHYENQDGEILALDAIPPDGEGPFTWSEPINYLDNRREGVYDLFCLITFTSWDDDSVEHNRFYAKRFWDRFMNGNSQLRPGNEMNN